jgi:uncharacterized sodium:solute symporter family permease YidK
MDSIAAIVFILGCVLVAAYSFYSLRKSLIYSIRMERVQTIDEINLNRVAGEVATSYYCAISYNSMLWDLRKWTYKQWFPNGY